MSALYLHNWAENRGDRYSGLEAVKSDFEIGDAELKGVEILVADYTYEDYNGDAYVLFRRDGKLYEVHGEHCSCFGLEGQWDPEEADAEAVRRRVKKGYWGDNQEVRAAILAALDRFEASAA